MARNIYLASSWRNKRYEKVLKVLVHYGHIVYDFRNPEPGNRGFAWKQTGFDRKQVAGLTIADPHDIHHYLNAIDHPIAIKGFALDKSALDMCDTLVLLLPCGRSAHIEAGYAIGQGKTCHILLDAENFEPELMYLLAGRANIHATMPSLLSGLQRQINR